jgi:ribosomal protein S4
MIIFIKHRYYYYRRFEHDIWGLCFLDIATSDNPLSFGAGYNSNRYLKGNNEKNLVDIVGEDNINKSSLAPKSWLLRFFYRLFSIAEDRRYQRLRRYIYRIDVISHTKRRRKFNKRFLSLRIARLYFLTLKDYQFRSLFRRASKLDGNLESNYCLLLECRVMAILYRTNFLWNIFEILQFIKAGYLFIDSKKAIHVNSQITNSSRINCSNKAIPRLRHFLIKRLENQIILFNTPKFLFVSYYFFFAYICKLPTKKDFVYPFSLDIQRITGYN